MKMKFIYEIDRTLDSAVSYLIDKSEIKEEVFLSSLLIIFICKNPYCKSLNNLRKKVKNFNLKKEKKTLLERIRCIIEQKRINIKERNSVTL